MLFSTHQQWKVGKPYNAANARHVDFPNFFRFGVNSYSIVVDIGGVRQGVSDLLRAIYTKPLGIWCGFTSILNLNFGLPNFGGRGAPMVVGISGVGQGITELLQTTE